MSTWSPGLYRSRNKIFRSPCQQPIQKSVAASSTIRFIFIAKYSLKIQLIGECAQ